MQKIAYLTGFKGFCAIGVTLIHYFIAFGDFGYFGWQSGVEVHEKISHFWAYFPFSLVSNGNAFLYAFFALIAFIPALRFFSTYDVVWIKKQIIVRYFRFIPYTLSITLLSYGLYLYEQYYHLALGQALQIPWNGAMLQGEFSFWGAVTSALFKVFVMNDGSYVSPLWCMHIIFIGSYLTYAVLLFLGTLSQRCIWYALLLALSYYAPFYFAFIFGIMAADIFLRYKEKNLPYISALMFILGFLCAFFGELLVYNVHAKLLVQNFGVFLLLLGLSFTKKLQNFFAHPFFLWCGRRSFELILMHFLLMFTLSAWMFLELQAMLGYTWALLLTFVLAIPLNAVGMIAYEKIMAPLTSMLSSAVYAYVIKSERK